MASLFRPTFRCKSTGETKRVKKWYAKVRHADGTVRKVPLSTNKAAAEMMLGQLLTKIEHEKAGITDPFERHGKHPLSGHLTDWEVALRGGDVGVKHVSQMVRCARRVLDGCKFVYPADVTPAAVRSFLSEMRGADENVDGMADREWYTKAELATLLGVKPSAVTPLVKRHGLSATGNGKARRYPRATADALLARRVSGASVATANRHLTAVKAFFRWLVADRRAAHNPLAGVKRVGNPEHDRRVEFATLTADEIAALIAAARTSSEVFRGLAGVDRASLYLTATYTAFRPIELARLTPADFHLAGPVPLVRLDGTRTKNGQTAEQPLPVDVAAELRAYLATRPAGGPVWPGTWAEKAADLIRVDLSAAGIPATKPGTDGRVRVVSFYSLRHSVGLLAEQGGATVREVMALMRHSDPKLTLKTYGRLQLDHLGRTVANMPSVLPAGGESLAPGLPQLGPKLGQVGDGPCGDVRASDGLDESGEGKKPLKNVGNASNCDHVMGGDGSAPGGTRTFNPLIKSQLLCQLSYRGMSYRVSRHARLGSDSPPGFRHRITPQRCGPSRGRPCRAWAGSPAALPGTSSLPPC